MDEILVCNAYQKHWCMLQQVKSPIICCHNCSFYESCVDRCENDSHVCGMAKAADDAAFVYRPAKEATARKGKRIAQCDENGNVITVFPSAREAARAMDSPLEEGLKAAQIGRCARGEREVALGYTWRFC